MPMLCRACCVFSVVMGQNVGLNDKGDFWPQKGRFWKGFCMEREINIHILIKLCVEKMYVIS